MQTNQSTSTSTTSSDQKMNFNTPAIQVGNNVRDGDEFVLITRSKQGEGFRIWSSSDKSTTEQLYRQAASELLDKQPA